MADLDVWVSALDRRLAPMGFVRRPAEGAVAAWVRKTWNTNRAVALLELPPGADPVSHVARVRAELGRSLGYVPFFYGVGMQLVLVGPAPQGSLEDAIDRYDTQRELVQSVFVVDPAARTVTAARTWGQVITGRFQDAVAAALAGALGQPAPPVVPVETPLIGRLLPWLLGALALLFVIRLLIGLA